MNITLTKQEGIQVGHLSQRGGVDHMTIRYGDIDQTILCLYDAASRLLATVIMDVNGNIISDSQAK